MLNDISLYRKDKTNLWILYFIILGVIQALWINTSSFPPLPLRVMMLVAVFAPLVIKRELVLFAFPFFMILRSQLSTDYQYLPDIYSYHFYIALIFIFLVVHRIKLTNVYLKNFGPLIIICLYYFLLDACNLPKIGPYAIHIFIALLLALFLKNRNDINILSASLIAASALLSIYYILMYDQFLESWNKAEGIDRSGWVDPNYFAILLSYGFMIAIGYILDYIKCSWILFNKKLLIIFCCCIYAAIILTASRAGFISASIIALYALIKSRPKFSTLLLFIIISCTFLAVLYHNGVFDTLFYRLFEQGNFDTGGDRTTIWMQVIDNYGRQKPLAQLLGGGYWHRTVLSNGVDTHNEFFAILSDYGLMGLCLFMWLIFSLFKFIGGGNKRLINVGSALFLLSLVSLSPFQYINICFLLIWIIGLHVIQNDSNNL